MITMSDIAKRAGVSLTTTSFVLNGGERAKQIGAATQARVLEVAREMGYRRNGLAHAVAAGRNNVFGYLSVELSEQDALLLDGIVRASAGAGYLVKLLGRSEEEHDLEVARHCVEQRLAGLIIRRHGAAVAVREELRDYHIPVVFVDDYRDDPGAGCIGSDDRGGYRQALEHLIGLGHQRLAYVAGGSSLPQERIREDSFRRITSERGLPVRDEWVVNCGWDYGCLETLTRHLFADPASRPTALLCDGDPLAAVVMRTLSGLGLRVPQDVSVVGYGGFYLAALLTPPLTTIMQPFQDIGKAAVHYLLHTVGVQRGGAAAEAANLELLPTRLVLGASTAAPSPASRLLSSDGSKGLT